MKITDTLAWNLYVELRKELVATQQLRSRATQFKITLVSAGIGLIVANRGSIDDDRLLILPAFAAVFFDFLIASYTFSIKRKGDYLRETLERQLRVLAAWPAGELLWEEHVRQPENRQMFSVIGNVGITVIVALPGVLAVLRAGSVSGGLLVLALLGLIAWIVVIYGRLDYFAMIRWRRKKGGKAEAPTPAEDLFDAVRSRDRDRVREILRRHPDAVSARDADGATALHYAAESGDREIAVMLVDAGADINARDGQFHATPAGWAIEYLRRRGALLGIEIEDAAHAIASGDAEWVRRFLARFPSLREAADRGGTPLEVRARESGNGEIARLFE